MDEKRRTMRGRLSKELREVLRDPEARAELAELLLHGRSGMVSVAGKRYALGMGETKTEVHVDAMTLEQALEHVKALKQVADHSDRWCEERKARMSDAAVLIMSGNYNRALDLLTENLVDYRTKWLTGENPNAYLAVVEAAPSTACACGEERCDFTNEEGTETDGTP